jgi:hypothetical protein
MGERPILNVLKVVGITVLILFIIALVIINISTSRRQSSTEEAPRINNEFNNLFATNKGSQLGNDVRALISKLISNAQRNSSDATKLPDLYYQPDENGEFILVTSTVENPNIAELEVARDKISGRHSYFVSYLYSRANGNITGVIIKYRESTKASFKPNVN